MKMNSASFACAAMRGTLRIAGRHAIRRAHKSPTFARRSGTPDRGAKDEGRQRVAQQCVRTNRSIANNATCRAIFALATASDYPQSALRPHRFAPTDLEVFLI